MNVINGAVDEFYLVGHHAQRVVTHLVGTAQRCDVGSSVENQLSCQIDGV